jgi:glutamate-ammonia-ligase adenylyltransferase
MTSATFNRCLDLLCKQLSDDEVQELLSPVGFADWCAANRCLLRLASDPRMRQTLADLLPHLLTTLASTAGPDRVLVSLERFAHSAPDRVATFDYLANNPRAVEILVTLFAGSQFLTEILLRNPEYFERLMEHKSLAHMKSVEELYT